MLASVLSCSFTPFLMQSNEPLHTILADFHRIINHYLILSIFPPTLALTSFSHHRDIYASFSKTLLFSPSPQPQTSSNCWNLYLNFPNTFPTQMVEVGLVAPNSPRLRYCCNGNLNDLLVRCGRPGLGEGLVRRLLAEVPGGFLMRI